VFVVMLASPGTKGGGHVLAFDPKLEAIDFKNFPMFLDGRIKDAVRDGLAAQKSKLTWDFKEQLSLVRPASRQDLAGGRDQARPYGR
jgi:hypothetical protein